MKCFDDNTGWGSKVNFVDRNNVLLGYDMHQDCCENAGWFVADAVTGEEPDDGASDFAFGDGWAFDPAFFEEVTPSGDKWGAWTDAGGIVAFRIVHDDGREKFLHLYNAHNGYYGHGFDFKVGDEVKREGSL